MNPNRVAARVLPAMLVLTLLASPSTAMAQKREVGALPKVKFKGGDLVRQAFKDVVRKTSMATVRIESDRKHIALGAIVNHNGYILTKASELRDYSSTIEGKAKPKLSVKLTDGRQYAAKLIATDFDSDLGLLKVDAAGLPTITWGDTKKAEVGDWIATVGADRQAVAVGVVSVKPRAIPRVPPVMGINIAEDRMGPRVRQVFPNTGAAEAGLQPDDIIVNVRGVPTPTREGLIRLLGRQNAGDRIDVGVLRGEQKLQLKVMLKSRQKVFPMNPRAAMQNALGGALSSRRDGFSSVLQHDTVLAPTNCGGPLVNLDGEVVGINVARAGRVSSYAVPSEVAKKFIAKHVQARKTAKR